MSHVGGLVSGFLHQETPLAQRAKCGSSAEVGPRGFFTRGGESK